LKAKRCAFKIYRYDPDKDSKPYMQDYDLKLEDTDRMLLDALVRIKQQDDSLTLRRSCREGVCGSDAMNINGKNGLACITRLADLKDPVELRPLPGLPVIRDLVVDMSQFFKQYNSVQPYLVNEEPRRTRSGCSLRGARELTACGSASCAPAARPPVPSFWWNPDKFVGPAGLLQAYRFLCRFPRSGDQRALD
jgi:succinate dehydrogenase / fumarate reductase iron-sulfur subunit